MSANDQPNTREGGGDSTKAGPDNSKVRPAKPDNRPLFTYLGKMPKQKPLNYLAIAAAILGTGILVLVILPLGAYWIASSTNCCFTDSTSNLLTFWAAILGGFIALFGMVISGLFVVIQIRIDNASKSEATRAVNEVLGEYLQVNEDTIIENFRTMVEASEKLIEGAVKETKQKAKSAQEEIAETTSNVKEASERAVADIAKYSSQVEQAQNRAVRQIQQAGAQVGDARNGAASRISELVAEVEQERNEALRRMQPPEEDEASGA